MPKEWVVKSLAEVFVGASVVIGAQFAIKPCGNRTSKCFDDFWLSRLGENRTDGCVRDVGRGGCKIEWNLIFVKVTFII